MYKRAVTLTYILAEALDAPHSPLSVPLHQRHRGLDPVVEDS